MVGVVQNIYHSVDSPSPLILFILILLTSNQYPYRHEHPVLLMSTQ
jgi:hypothetical protein